MRIEETEYATVSSALVLYCDISSTVDRKRQVEARYGADILAKAEFVYHAAMDCPVWQDGTMDSALAGLADFLTTHYPWLTPEAKRNLNYRFIMNWK